MAYRNDLDASYAKITMLENKLNKKLETANESPIQPSRHFLFFKMFMSILFKKLFKGAKAIASAIVWIMAVGFIAYLLVGICVNVTVTFIGTDAEKKFCRVFWPLWSTYFSIVIICGLLLASFIKHIYKETMEKFKGK